MNTAPSQYFSGQGIVFLSRLTALGVPTGFTALGNCSSLSLRPSPDLTKYAIGGAEILEPLTRKGEPSTLAIGMESLSRDNLALALYGLTASVPAAANVAETLVAYRGRTIPLSHINVTSVISVYNGATIYTQGSDYTLNPAGSLNIPASSAIPDGQSVVVYYNHDAYDSIDAYTTAPARYALRFEGLNALAPKYSPVVVDVFNTRLLTISQLDLITEDNAALAITARIYRDVLNGFFRIRQVPTFV